MSFEEWWDKLNGTSTELLTDDEKVARIGFEAGWDAGQAELREPSPCKIDGHWAIDWVERKRPTTHAFLWYCRSCEREAELRRKVEAVDKLSATWKNPGHQVCGKTTIQNVHLDPLYSDFAKCLDDALGGR